MDRDYARVKHSEAVSYLHPVTANCVPSSFPLPRTAHPPCSAHSVALQRAPCRRCTVSRPAPCRICPPAAFASFLPSSMLPMQRVPVLQSACSREHSRSPTYHASCRILTLQPPGPSTSSAPRVRSCPQISSFSHTQTMPPCSWRALSSRAAGQADIITVPCGLLSQMRTRMSLEPHHLLCSTSSPRAAGCAVRPCCYPTASALVP
jgi:hypothetical protein